MESFRPVRPLGDWGGVLAGAVLVMGFGVFLEVFTPYVVAFTAAPGRPLYLAANALLLLGSAVLLFLLGSHVVYTAGRDD